MMLSSWSQITPILIEHENHELIIKTFTEIKVCANDYLYIKEYNEDVKKFIGN